MNMFGMNLNLKQEAGWPPHPHAAGLSSLHHAHSMGAAQVPVPNVTPEQAAAAG